MEKRHFVYPRIETEQEGQFPFDIPQYLLIDMQLGGTWVGPVGLYGFTSGDGSGLGTSLSMEIKLF